MSIALSTIFILVLILPGIFFRFSYLKGPYSRQSFRPSTIDELVWAIVPSLFIHICGYTFIDYFTKYKVSFSVLFSLMSSEYDQMDYALIDSNVYPFILYLSVTMLFSFAGGLLIRRLVMHWKLDYRYNFFRVNNDWYYILTNAWLDQRSKNHSKNSSADFIQVDALVKADKECNVIYSGILHDFYLSKDEGLDKICLVEVYRRNFNDDLTKRSAPEPFQNGLDERYYNMPGDLFVIPYKEILNLNISYYTFATDKQEEQGTGTIDPISQ